MSILQLNREREKNIFINNKENENFLDMNSLSYQNERRKISSGGKDLTKFSSKTIQSNLYSVALKLNNMGSKIHPINLPSFKNEFNHKESSDVTRSHLRNLNKSHSDKLLPNILKRQDFEESSKNSSHSRSYTSTKFVEKINFGDYEKIIIQNIFKLRENAAIAIQNIFRRTYAQKKIKVVYLLEKILKVRKESTLKFQSNFKGFICRRNISQIFIMKEEENYPFFYYKKISIL